MTTKSTPIVTTNPSPISGKVIKKPRQPRTVPTEQYAVGDILEVYGYDVKLFYVTRVSSPFTLTVKEVVLEPTGLYNTYRVPQPVCTQHEPRRATYNRVRGWSVRCGTREIDRKCLCEYAWDVDTVVGKWFTPRKAINYND